MAYDVVIRGGTVVDGTGATAFRADVAVSGDRIVAVGKIDGKGATEVDAEGPRSVSNWSARPRKYSSSCGMSDVRQMLASSLLAAAGDVASSRGARYHSPNWKSGPRNMVIARFSWASATKPNCLMSTASDSDAGTPDASRVTAESMPSRVRIADKSG